MREYELDDIAKAAAGDPGAQLRVRRRMETLEFNAWKRKEAMKRAIPAWADLRAIDAFYIKARELTASTGVLHEVDHIVPIQGRKVCGLHVEHNLQILSKAGNIRKHAKFDDWGPAPRRRKIALPG